MRVVSATVAIGLQAGFSTFLTIGLLKPVAEPLGLLDVPDSRKHHKGAIPLIGGLALFGALLVTWLTRMPVSGSYGIFFTCALAIVLLGSLDDARNLGVRIRLLVQTLVALALMAGTGQYLQSFGNLLDTGNIALGWSGVLVTVIAVIGAINAFNMIDGIDGLLGSTAFVSFASMGVLFALHGHSHREVIMAVLFVSVLIPYLIANLTFPPFKRKIFMGDAGSMLIGFSVVWLLIKGSQGQDVVFHPVTALWLIAVPLMDMASLMICRMRRGMSPFKPDREHLHHLFMRSGCTDRQALVVITLLSLVCAGIGVVGSLLNVPEWLMFGGFLALFAVYKPLMRRLCTCYLKVRELPLRSVQRAQGGS